VVTDYDEGDTAELYRRAKNTLPIYQVDTHSLMQRAGDVSGRKVLDVACGEGHFTRLMRQADHEPGFWDELLAHPVFVLFDCVKA